MNSTVQFSSDQESIIRDSSYSEDTPSCHTTFPSVSFETIPILGLIEMAPSPKKKEKKKKKKKKKKAQDRRKTLSSASWIFSADKIQMKSMYLHHNTHKERKKEVQEDKVLCTHTHTPVHTHIHACTQRYASPTPTPHTHKYTCMLEPVFILTLSKPVFWFEQKKKKNLLQMNKQTHVIPKTRIVHTVHKLCINKMVYLHVFKLINVYCCIKYCIIDGQQQNLKNFYTTKSSPQLTNECKL